MSQADQIQHLLQLKMDQYKGPITPEVLNRFTDEVMQAINQKPQSHAEGLTPEQLHGLLHFLFTERSVVKLNRFISDPTALQSPLLKLCISFLEIIQREETIKLTKTGALPLKIVGELYQKGIIVETVFSSPTKVRTETDSISIQLVKLLAQIAGLTKKREGKLSLTAKGISLLKSPVQLLILLTETYFLKFAWGYFDLYESQQAAQFGAGYTLLLLQKYGKQEREATFYAKKFLEAFPMVVHEFEPSYSSPEEQFNHCFTLRTFVRGFKWLGFIEILETEKWIEETQTHWIKTTPLFDELVTTSPRSI